MSALFPTPPPLREAGQARQSQFSMACRLDIAGTFADGCLPLRSRTYARPPAIRGQLCWTTSGFSMRHSPCTHPGLALSHSALHLRAFSQLKRARERGWRQQGSSVSADCRLHSPSWPCDPRLAALLQRPPCRRRRVAPGPEHPRRSAPQFAALLQGLLWCSGARRHV